MAKVGRGRSFIASEIRKNFSSFYIFGDLSTTKKDLVGKNDLTYESQSPSLFYGRDCIGELFDGTKYLSNRSITPTVTGFPLFLFVHMQDTSSTAVDGELITISPWVTNYLKRVHIAKYLGTPRVGGEINEDFSSYTNQSKTDPAGVYAAAYVMRSITNFTCFVNGEKLTQFQTNATTFETPKNSVVIGASSNGSIAHHGGIFSAGWGTSDPGDDFFRRLTLNPNAVMFQKSIIPSYFKSAASGAVAKFRKTLSRIGTKAGTRQSY